MQIFFINFARATAQVIHSDARPTALFYVSAILSLYLVGLAVILVHYMNSCYGAWNWSAADVWREIRPRRLSEYYGGLGPVLVVGIAVLFSRSFDMHLTVLRTSFS